MQQKHFSKYVEWKQTKVGKESKRVDRIRLLGGESNDKECIAYDGVCPP